MLDWVKNFTFSILSSLEVNFSTNFYTQLNCVATIVFRADTDNIRKIVSFTYTEEAKKIEFETWAEIPNRGQNLIL